MIRNPSPQQLVAEARKILTRLTARVDEQRHAKTNASFRVAMEAWLRTHEVEETTREGYERYARRLLYPAFGDEPIGKVTTRFAGGVLHRAPAVQRALRRPAVRGAPHQRGARVPDREAPAWSGSAPAAGYQPHDCAEVGCEVTECRPLAAATIRRIHFAIRGVLSAAQRWEWITSNPAVLARKPRQPTPQPDPPTVAQASRIIEAAWAEDDGWGTLVLLVMVTGIRRAELLALRWSDVDLAAGVVTVRRNYVRVNRQSIEKDTKTHQEYRISLADTRIIVRPGLTDRGQVDLLDLADALHDMEVLRT